jgi:hypothetical protein
MFPVLFLGFWLALSHPAHARREVITLPVVLTDYYGFAYAQACRDRSYGFFYPTAGVDVLGWTILAVKGKYSGMFLVNFAGVAKTVYPLVILGGKPDREKKQRAWISVGTHAGSILWLKIWGKPALAVSSWVPENGTAGARFALAF